MRENACKQGILFLDRDQHRMTKRLHDTQSLDLLPDSLTQKPEQETEKSEHNTLPEITLY